MRCIYLIVTVICFSSCKVFKPVVDKNQAATQRRTAAPVFIESISSQSSVSNNTVFVSTPVTGSVTNSNNYNVIEQLEVLPFKYSILLDVAVEELSNPGLLRFMNEWYGTRYKFGGTTKNGIDCSAFSGALLLNVFGIGLPRIAKDQYKVCERVKKDALQEGDLVFFHTTRKGISHVGVYLRNNKFIHASLNYGVVISDLNDPYYSRTFVGAGRPSAAATVTTAAAN
ncbi:MAG: hypothetical protein RLZZ316_628 [Bacteroidota bacterium]